MSILTLRGNMLSVTKSDLANTLFNKLGLNKREAKEFVELFFEKIKLALGNGDSVKFSGFGNFEVREKSPRPGLNPKTGEKIPITARLVVMFKASQKLKDRIAANVDALLRETEKIKDKVITASRQSVSVRATARNTVYVKLDWILERPLCWVERPRNSGSPGAFSKQIDLPLSAMKRRYVLAKFSSPGARTRPHSDRTDERNMAKELIASDSTSNLCFQSLGRTFVRPLGEPAEATIQASIFRTSSRLLHHLGSSDRFQSLCTRSAP